MNVHTHRVAAIVLFVAGGVIAAVAATAIAIAKILADAGMAVRPADAALLSDLAAILPLVIAFAGLNVLAAVGLLTGKSWAETIGLGTAAVAVAGGATGLILNVLGSDPSQLTRRATIDGITVLALFTILYLAAIAALSLGRSQPQVTAIGAPA
jgi:hypothetical protein